jgi:hypothetical protein
MIISKFTVEDFKSIGSAEIELGTVNAGKASRRAVSCYEARQQDMSNAWPRVRPICREAEWFSVELLNEAPDGNPL